MQESFPSRESREQEKEIKIVLHFMRHDEKENDKAKPDVENRLTSAGKLHAKGLASPETNVGQSVAFGSPRKRTQETAGLVMAGSLDEITGTETLEELNEKLNKDLKVGKKIGVDPMLDFTMPAKGPYFDELMAAFKSGRLLKYLVEESDQKVNDFGIPAGICSYSDQASQVAKIIQKYLKILPRWEKLANDKTKSYQPIMERFMGSHQSVGESFLAKVIEITRGIAERDAFVAVLDGGGFDFAEGFKAEIVSDENGEEKIHITFKKEKDGENVFEFDETISRELIDGLII